MGTLRLRIQCPSGESRLLQVSGEATVLDLKQMLEEQEGIPCHQQVLCFAGQHLKDHLTLREHYMEFTLSDEVVLFLSKRLTKPKTIFLSTLAKPSQVVPELVEADMPVGEVSNLLESRSLASACTGMPILIKRQDGSTVPIAVNPAEGLSRLEIRIATQEKVNPTNLTFCQAQDGALHCIVNPSAMQSSDTYPVYHRKVQPQPVMHKKAVVPGQKYLFTDLSRELCVLP